MEQSFPEIEILHPECSFLDEQLAERIALRAILSDPELRGIYISSAGRSGVYNALVQSGCANRVHVVVHDATPDNLELIRKGAVDSCDWAGCTDPGDATGTLAVLCAVPASAAGEAGL